MAHDTETPPTLATAWSVNPAYVAVPLLALGMYAVGQARLWHRAGHGRGVSRLEAAAFWLGALLAFFALVWPLDALGEWSLAAHMSQHMLLLAFVPPLLLAGRPFAIYAQVLPQRWLRPIHLASARSHARLTADLAGAALVHSVVLLLWHVPALTGRALENEAIHLAMHSSFLLSGLWFWAALIHCVRNATFGVGAGLIALLAIMIQMGLLGGLLTFSRRVLYPVYAERAPQLGLDPLSDQQLAGLIMWVPACVPYLIGGIWLLARHLRRSVSSASV